jgi:hypothetical protein
LPFPNPKRVTKEDFGKDEYEILLKFIYEKLKYLKARTRGIRETLMPKWIRIYRGIPAEQTATWPWPGASNLVIQVAATHSDELLARVMAIYMNDPLFVAQLLGDFDDDDDEMGGEAQKAVLEFFLTNAAYEPEELDLYRVEETGNSSAIRYGTGIFKFPWEYVVEKQYIYIGGGTEPGTDAKYEPKDFVRRDGPHPECVPLQDWLIDPKFPNLAQADFKAHTIHFNLQQLMALKAHPEIYDPDKIDEIAKSPTPKSETQRQVEEQKQMDQFDGERMAEQFDIEECWFTYLKDNTLLRMVAYFHIEKELCLGIIMNPYPELIEPFEDSKLAYDSDEYFGYGFCEMLEAYQREVSTTHNWRINNRHFATTGVGRVNKNSKLSSIVELFPGVLIPADEGEIEPLQFGQNAMAYTTEDEQLTLALAKERSGVDPAIGGTGGGVVNPKRGIYSTGGTSIVLQQQNNRNNLRMSDMRSAHVRIGRKLLLMYSHFGLGDKIRKYGNKGPVLKKALDSYKNRKLGLVIKPATASMNKEMEKQNDILLQATLDRIDSKTAQMLQAIIQPGCPPQLQDLYAKQIKAAGYFTKQLLHKFDREDADRLISEPDLSFLKKERANATGSGNNQAGGGVVQEQGQNQSVVPATGGAVGGGIPSTNEG